MKNKPMGIDTDALARFVQKNYEQLLDDNFLQTSFPDDALRAISLALISIDRHLASIDRSLNYAKDARQ